MSNICTVGADYKYCYEVIPDSTDKMRSINVRTIHECRQICDDTKDCMAFEYHAGADWKEQLCNLFFGRPEHWSVRLLPNFSRCNQEEWLYSWNRQAKTSQDCEKLGT